MGEDHFLRVAVGKVGERVVATPLAGGAGVLMSLVKADGIVTIPRFSEGYEAGATVNVELLRPASSIDKTIVVIGSHDNGGLTVHWTNVTLVDGKGQCAGYDGTSYAITIERVGGAKELYTDGISNGCNVYAQGLLAVYKEAAKIFP